MVTGGFRASNLETRKFSQRKANDDLSQFWLNSTTPYLMCIKMVFAWVIGEYAGHAYEVNRLAINTALLPPNAKEFDMTALRYTFVLP